MTRIELTDELKAKLNSLNELDPNITTLGGNPGHAEALQYLRQDFGVFRMTDSDWWMAQSLTEARRDHTAHCANCGYDVDEDEYEHARELTKEEMNGHVFHDDGLEMHSFAVQLSHLIERNPVSQIFATAEY